MNSWWSNVSVRLRRQGCTNRPFYHIVAIMTRKGPKKEGFEQIGTYDPMPNVHNEKLVAVNFERLRYWLAQGAAVSRPVACLLGLSGFTPVHPYSYIVAKRNRLKAEEEAAKADEAKEEVAANSTDTMVTEQTKPS